MISAFLDTVARELEALEIPDDQVVCVWVFGSGRNPVEVSLRPDEFSRLGTLPTLQSAIHSRIDSEAGQDGNLHSRFVLRGISYRTLVRPPATGQPTASMAQESAHSTAAGA